MTTVDGHVVANRPGSLRECYDQPEVPIGSGPDRARRQLRMLGEVLSEMEDRPAAPRILDVGCGDGAATSLVAGFDAALHVVGVDWSTRALLAAGVQPIFSEVSLRGIHGRPGHEVVGHLRLFTRRALAGLLAAGGFTDIRIAGARYHDVPRPLRPLDRAFCAWPAAASILLARGRRRA